MLLLCNPETEKFKHSTLQNSTIVGELCFFFFIVLFCSISLCYTTKLICYNSYHVVFFSPDGRCGRPVRAVRGRLPPQHEHRRQGPEPLAAQPVRQPPLGLLGILIHRCRAFWTVNSSPPAIATDKELRQGFRKETILWSGARWRCCAS